MLGSTTGCWANGCSAFGMLVQAGRRWKAKNSPLCRARQAASWAPSGFPRPTNPLLLCSQNEMRGLCGATVPGRKGWSQGERQPSTPCLLKHVAAAWRVFSREKGRLPRPWPVAALCEQRGAICTTTALFCSVCALLSTAEPALSQGLVGLQGRHRLDHKALPLPQSHPWTLPEWGRAQPWKTCLPSHAQELFSPSSCLLYNIPNTSPRGK